MQSLLLECAVRAVLIAAGTAAILLALRVQSPSVRHAAWLGVVAWMLLLPVCAAWLPQARLRVLPAPKAVTIRAVAVPAATAPLPSAPDLPSPDLPAPRPAWNWLLAAYLLGAAVLLVRLAAGAARAHLLMRTACPAEDHWISSSCVAPVTVGWLRPRVILPEGWREWPPAQLSAVLCHEREHARRRDPLMQFLALLNRALFWFHPLAWWLERRLSALAEEACDAAALSSGHDPYDYSYYLLDIARTVERSGLRVNVLGMAMPGNSLSQRIRRILAARPVPPISRARTVCAAAACLLLSSLFAAGALVHQRPLLLAAVRETPAAAPTANPSPAPPAPAPIPTPAAPSPVPQQPQTARLIVLYFPLSVLSPDDHAAAVTAARKFVSTQMQATDRVSIMTYDGAAKVLQDFTNDPNLLAQALNQVPNGQSVQQDPGRLLDALQTAVNLLGPLKEKKALIYFARSMPQAGQNIQALVDAARQANVAFYAIDLAGIAKPQTPQDPPAPEFEAASVKPVDSSGALPGTGGRGGRGGISSPGPNRVIGRNSTLGQLIRYAYNVRAYQVSGPEWLDGQRYDVDAKSAAAATPAQSRQMLQALLADRFRLALHRETRDLPVYEMTVADGGPKMPPVKPGETLQPQPSRPGLTYVCTTATFADIMGNTPPLDLPVVDKTGLTAWYHFDLTVGPDFDLIPALRDQLGLKLTAAKAPTEILVIDHAEKIPAGN